MDEEKHKRDLIHEKWHGEDEKTFRCLYKIGKNDFSLFYDFNLKIREMGYKNQEYSIKLITATALISIQAHNN